MKAFDKKEEQIQVMILGIYHMDGGKGKHVYEQEIEDVLSPKRQKEIQLLAKNLAKWEPDIIAVEVLREKENLLNAIYLEYLEGKRNFEHEENLPFLSSRNEVVQIGFRIAKYLNHKKILAVDFYPDYPEWITIEMIREVMYHKPSGFYHEKLFAENIKKSKELPIPDYLYWLNSQPMVNLNDSVMIDISLEYENRKVAFAVASNWFERNLGIVRNLKEALPPDVKKVLLLYGAGHVPLLKYIIEVSSRFNFISPLPYLKNPIE